MHLIRVSEISLRKDDMTTEPTPGNLLKNPTLLVTTFASFLVPFMMSSINVLLPAIGREYQLDVITLSWITTSYMLASVVLMIPFGRIADIQGKRKVFLYGVTVFMLGTVLSAVAVSGVMLLAARIVQGIGGAGIMATAVALLTSAVPAEERGKALGINTAATYIGLSCGPFVGGVLTEQVSWRSVFGFVAAASLIVIAIAFWKLKKDYGETKSKSFDLTGSVIYCLTLIAFMYGLSSITSITGIVLVVVGITGGIFFYWWENRTHAQLVNMELFRHNRGFAMSNLAALINYAGVYAISFILPLFLQYAKGFSAEVAGTILVANPVVQAIFSPLTGRLSDKIEPRILASAGMAVTTLGIGLLIFINQQTSVAYIIMSLVILGFGFALFSSPNINAVMSSVGRQYYGFASATLGTGRQTGMMLNMGITMVVFALVIGRAQITPEYYPAFIDSAHIVYIISTALCFFAVFISLARGNIHSGGHGKTSEKSRQ